MCVCTGSVFVLEVCLYWKCVCTGSVFVLEVCLPYLAVTAKDHLTVKMKPQTYLAVTAKDHLTVKMLRYIGPGTL